MVTIKPPSVLDIKILLRKLFDNPNTLFRIIAYNPQNGKVRPIISTYKLYQPMISTYILYQEEEVVSSDVRTAQLEITSSAPDEEVLCEEYPSRMKCCVDPGEDMPDLTSDEEIPDLVTNPDLTYEDKEAQEQKADQDFDIDTEVAIQQSLDLCIGYQQLTRDQTKD